MLAIARLGPAVLAVTILLAALAQPAPRAGLVTAENASGENRSSGLKIKGGPVIIRNVTVGQRGDWTPSPILHVPEITITPDWQTLLAGAFVASAVISSPDVTYTPQAKTKAVEDRPPKEWIDKVHALLPFKLTTLRIDNGTIRYRDLKADPKIDIVIGNFNLMADNLTNRDRLKDQRFATVKANALVAGSGRMNLDMRLDPTAQRPVFDLNTELQNLDLTALNDFLEAYGGFTVKKGRFSAFMEVAVENGKFKGYVKPFMEGVEVLGGDEKDRGVLRKAWEALVAGAIKILESPGEKDQVAAKVPLSGTFENPDMGVWETIVSLLRNGFIQALNQGLEGSVGIGGK